MSKISDAYDAIVLQVQNLLPSHVRLSNPYAINENTESALRQGWGIALLSGTNTERNIGCKLSVSRQFSVVLTRKMYANELNVEGKASTEKQLFEDQFTLIQAFESDPTLGLTDIAALKWESDNGLEFVFGEKDNFLQLNSTFTVEYFEQLT